MTDYGPTQYSRSKKKHTYTIRWRRTWTFSRILLKVPKFSSTSVPKKSKFGSIKTVYHRLKQSCTTTGKLPSRTRKRTNCTTTTNALFLLVTNYTNMLITTKENNTFCNLRGSEFISSISNKTLYSENELQCSSLPQSAHPRHYRHLYRRGNPLKRPAIDCQTRNFFTYRVGLPNWDPLHS